MDCERRLIGSAIIWREIDKYFEKSLSTLGDSELDQENRRRHVEQRDVLLNDLREAIDGYRKGLLTD